MHLIIMFLQKNARVVTIDGYEDVPQNDEKSLKKAVANQPVSVAIEAGGRDFQLYQSVSTAPHLTNHFYALASRLNYRNCTNYNLFVIHDRLKPDSLTFIALLLECIIYSSLVWKQETFEF